MKFRLGLRQFRKNWLLNWFIIIQMTIVFVIAIVACSIVTYNMKFYNAFSEYLTKDGMLVIAQDVVDENNYLYQDSKQFAEEIGNVNVLSCYNPWLELDEFGRNVYFTAYDSKCIGKYKPEMKTGQWLSEQPGDGSVIPVVVSCNMQGVKVGDVLVASTAEDCQISLQIVGILQENSKVFGHVTGHFVDTSDYRNMYYDFNEEDEENIVVLMNQSDVLAAQKYLKDESLVSTMGDVVLVKFDEGITEEMKGTLERQIGKSTINAVISYPMQEISDNSRNYIMQKMLMLIPVFLAAFILVIITSICVNSISVRKHLKDYAIYNICGMAWKDCLGINMVNTGLVVIISAVLTIGIALCFISGKVIMETTITLGVTEWFTCILVGVVQLLLSMLIPQYMIKRQSTKQVLIKNVD